MNYESKYKEALSFLKDLKPHMSDYCIEKLEGFFPELKETEDGKIRKEIIEYITRYKDCITDKEYDSWIAWLEKQGEQKSAWSEEDEKLTEFEKELNRIVISFSDAHAYMDETEIHHYSKGFLDLARKELQPEFDKELDKAYKTQDNVVYLNGYAQGKQDALKAALESLPKWKKANEYKVSKFKYTVTYNFDNCSNCPFKERVDDDYSPIHDECTRTDSYIKTYCRGGDTDYRNKEGILDNCPFLVNKIIKEEE